MSNSFQRLSQSIDNLEEIIYSKQKFDSNDLSEKVEALKAENQNLRFELDKLKQDYQTLKETSKDVINELNNSIEVIEDYFSKQNANNKNIKS